ncbi:hypothetical protein CYY_001509 [Polysphondylium violaceum]|uniref:AP-3 complex subunit delta n=1 Tax=Polysphondylium violaceum TaxID=133409 RepID=A0A8J4V440_9MYCE|nr:hypothetical protein CYY_001509 [Polysphondylium violaceum]
MFERSLVDLIRGIRNHKKNETRFINQCINEIKEELKGDIQKKTVAIQKLTYIQMLGYDISWASFKIVEVMSTTKFTSKRIGYLAASQSFHEGTDVIMLATNQIRKDFLSANQNEAYLALNCLSNICTPDLARDLANDILTLMNTQKTHILKRAVTVLYKIFLKYPEALRPAFPKLREKLDDPEPSIVSCSVNVICELARRNPKNYLPLAPVLFRILTNTTNNYWMLIKIVKLFASLTPHEPRLAKKLVDPLTNIINSSPSVSLLFECIQTCIVGMNDNIPLMKLCITKLRTLIEHNDQNLKYLGLLALNNIMKIHPKAVSEHRELVLNCLDDQDISIRHRALDLLPGMTTKKNIYDVMNKVLEHLDVAEGSYKDLIILKIIELCSMGTYQFISDFEWYINILVRLSQIQETSHGKLIASQFLDVVIRVKTVRAYGTKQMIQLLKNPKLMSNPTANGICEVLYAAAWIVGEFSNYVNQPVDALESFLQPRVSILPAHIQSVYMLNSLKVFSHACAVANGEEIVIEDDPDVDTSDRGEITQETVDECLQVLTSRLVIFTQSIYLDVQERACFVNEILKFYTVTKDTQGNSISRELISLFTEQLNPVGPKAQKKVPVPEGLDLDEWINDPKLQDPVESEDEDDMFTPGGNANNRYRDSDDESSHSGHSPHIKSSNKQHFTKEDIQRQKEERLSRQAANPFMLGGKGKRTTAEPELAPVATLPKSFGSLSVGTPGEKKKKAKPKQFVIDRTTEMPEGAKDSDSEDEKKFNKNDALGQINLNEPLTANDVLYTNRHRSDIIREKEQAAAAIEKARVQAARKAKSEERLAAAEKEQLKKSAKKAAAAAPAPAPAPPKKVVPVFINAVDDENFKISYEITKVADQNTQLKFSFKIQNKSDEDMSDVQLTVSEKDKEEVKAIKSSGEIGIMEAGSSSTHFEIIEFTNITTRTEITFNLSANPSSSPDVINTPITVRVPFVNFIINTKLPKDKFAEIVQKENMTIGSLKIPTANGKLNMSIVSQKLLNDLNINVVQSHPSGTTASFYALTNQNHHIAMLVKDRDGFISFDIKTSQPILLSTILIKELQLLFPSN